MLSLKELEVFSERRSDVYKKKVADFQQRLIHSGDCHCMECMERLLLSFEKDNT